MTAPIRQSSLPLESTCYRKRAMFIYLVENTKSSVVPASLKYAFDGCPVSSCELLSAGPGGQPGTLLSVDGSSLRYDADSQQWAKASPGVWVGLNSDDEIDTSSLLRKESLRGHAITLGDRSWVVPIARKFDSSSMTFDDVLPRHVVYSGESAEWVSGGVVARYRGLWDIAKWWWDLILGAALTNDEAGFASVDPQEAFTKAAQVLAVNYRVGPVELSLLNVFTSGSYGQIFDMLCDVPAYNEFAAQRVAELEKKRDVQPQA